jgi:hypothetical protein
MPFQPSARLTPKTAIAFGMPFAKASAFAHCSLRSTNYKVRLGKAQCATAQSLCEIHPKPIAVFGYYFMRAARCFHFSRIARPFVFSALFVFPTGAPSATPTTVPQSFYERPAFVESALPEHKPYEMTPASGGIVVFADGRDFSPRAQVKALVADDLADMVLLQGGYRRDFRPGMVCRVERGGKQVAEVVIVQSTPEHSVAFIHTDAATGVIQAGDTVKIKTVQL